MKIFIILGIMALISGLILLFSRKAKDFPPSSPDNESVDTTEIEQQSED